MDPIRAGLRIIPIQKQQKNVWRKLLLNLHTQQRFYQNFLSCRLWQALMVIPTLVKISAEMPKNAT